MTTIERIGQYIIAQHGAIFLVIDRQAGGHEVFTNARAARAAALDRVDVVDFVNYYENTAAISRYTTREMN